MKKKFLLITGGTGGHVIPAVNFANYLLNENHGCKIISDRRGFKYINNLEGKVKIIKSSNLYGNFVSKIFGLTNLLIGFFQSFYFILMFRPSRVISFGSYASFTPMICCILLKYLFNTKIFIHEQNSILGRTNKFFLHFTDRLFLNFDIKSKINNKYLSKTFIVGLPQKKTKCQKNKIIRNTEQNFTIFIFGGSQGSEYITNFSLKLIKEINREKIIKAKFIIQCPKIMIKKVSVDLKEIEDNIIIKEYFHNIEEVLQNTSIAISRAGAGSISDLINFKVPSILIPLPSSKDNHQFYNAKIMNNYNVAILLDQNKDEIIKAKKYIYKIYNDANDSKLIKKNFNNIIVKNSNALIYNLINYEN